MTGLPHFKYYDYRLAEAITSSGQVFIKRAKQAIDEVFTKLCKEKGEYALYLDTDSVVGDTLVYVNGTQVTIAELYDSISEFTHSNHDAKSFVKPVTDISTRSFNTTTAEIEDRMIEYVMKHRVQKHMYRVTVNGKAVTVTEDHAIIVQRGGKYISVKPSEITNIDCVMTIEHHTVEQTSNFVVEDLGIQDIDVYDIEVANNHNFFANDILVHNSCYIDCSKLVAQRWSTLSETEIVNKLEQLTFKIIQPAVNDALEKVVRNMGITDCKISFKLECIGPSIVFVAKKRYAFDILYSEGVRYPEPKMKVMGIEIVRSSTPAVVKDYLKDCLKLCLRSDESTLQKKVAEIKKEFMAQPYTNISFPRGVNGLTTYASPTSIYRKGDGVTTPIQVRAALLFNHHLEKQGLSNTYAKIAEGEKIKFVYLKMPNKIHENVIGYVDKLPEKLDLIRFIDYNTQWQKAFVAPLENITGAMNWTVEKKITLDMGF